MPNPALRASTPRSRLPIPEPPIGSVKRCCGCGAKSPGGASLARRWPIRRNPRWIFCVTIRRAAAFFATDPACLYLGAQIAGPEPISSGFLDAARKLGLNRAECFVLGLAMAAQIDGAMGPVLAACQNDATRPHPTIALAQALWDDPIAVLAAQDPGRPLLSCGLIEEPGAGRLAAPPGPQPLFRGHPGILRSSA